MERLESLVQHEIQHMLDRVADIGFSNKEYTAFLAELVFGSGLIASWLLNDNGQYLPPHGPALARIARELQRDLEVVETSRSLRTMRRPHDLKLPGHETGYMADLDFTQVTPSRLQPAARRLLNEAYLQAAGTTYDDMVAPFL